MKPLVIYHANCTDGFGAAFAAWLKLGDNAEYLPMEHGKVEAPEDFDMKVSLAAKGNTIYILDFSFPRPIMEALFAHAKKVVWLDHHKTAFEMWTGLYVKDGIHIEHDYDPGSMRPWVTLDDTKSGAMLAWEYFHPGTEVPMLIQHIDDRDRWQFKLTGTKELHAAFASYKPWTFDKWKVWLNDWDLMHRDDMVLEGLAILRAHNQNVQAALKQAQVCWIKALKPIDLPGSFIDGILPGWQGLAANAPSFLASDLGHELANKSGTFGLVWSMAGDGQVHCSLRSNGEYDVSAIAKAFGGGGHRNAAGFSTDINTLLEWLEWLK